MTTVTIQLDDELEEQLKKFSQASNLSMEEAVKELIRRKWELRKIRELRKNARAQAEKAGITSDEDVYQVVQDARRERRQSESAR